jgi:hypothetical protein
MERHRLLGDELEQFGQQPTLTFFVWICGLQTQFQQPFGLTLPCKDGLDNFHPTDAGQVADHVVKLDVHPLQHRLHLPHLTGCLSDVIGAQALVILQPANFYGRKKSAPQQPMGMQGRQPLAIAHVRLAPRQVWSVWSR